VCLGLARVVHKIMKACLRSRKFIFKQFFHVANNDVNDDDDQQKYTVEME